MLKILLFLGVSAFSFADTMPSRKRYPQIISHRGAAGYVPEHSLADYRLAIDLQTDYIEPDLCLSMDGVFVAMHDLLLDDTTNVASFPQFADRYTTKTVDGQNMTGYFISDFLYSELQELSLIQRIQGRSTLFNDLLKIPT
jgi:glycerophosphoryl diester phosphodiesterase